MRWIIEIFKGNIITEAQLYGLEKGDIILPLDIFNNFVNDKNKKINELILTHYQSKKGRQLAPLNPLSTRQFRLSNWDLQNLDWLHSCSELPVLQRLGEWLQPTKSLHIGIQHGYTIVSIYNLVNIKNVKKIWLLDSDPIRYPAAPIDDQKESYDHAIRNIGQLGIDNTVINYLGNTLDNVETINAINNDTPFDIIEVDQNENKRKSVIGADLLSVINWVSGKGFIMVHNVKNQSVYSAVSDFVNVMNNRIKAIQYVSTYRGMVLLKI